MIYTCACGYRKDLFDTRCWDSLTRSDTPRNNASYKILILCAGPVTMSFKVEVTWKQQATAQHN